MISWKKAYYAFLSTCNVETVAKLVLVCLRSLIFQEQCATSSYWADEYTGWDPEYTLHHETSKQHQKENGEVDILEMRHRPSRHIATGVPVDTEVETNVVDIKGIQVMIYQPRRQQSRLPAIVYCYLLWSDMEQEVLYLATTKVKRQQVRKPSLPLIPSLILLGTGFPVFVPAYRLAPEHHFPTGAEDLHCVSQHLRTMHGATRFNIDPYKVSLVGNSSGASHVLILMLRDARLKPEVRLHGVCAIAPIINHCAKHDDALRRRQKGPGLPASRMLAYQELYLPTSLGCSPGEANLNSLSLVEWQQLQLPPLYIAIMELDVLAAETLQLCNLLCRAEKQVKQAVWWGAPHATFVHGGIMEQSLYLQDSVVEFVKGDQDKKSSS